MSLSAITDRRIHVQPARIALNAVRGFPQPDELTVPIQDLNALGAIQDIELGAAGREANLARHVELAVMLPRIAEDQRRL